MSAYQGASTASGHAGPASWVFLDREALSAPDAGSEERVGLVVDGRGDTARLRMGALSALEPGPDGGGRLILATDRASAPKWLGDLKPPRPVTPSAFTTLIINLIEELAGLAASPRADDASVVVESILMLARTALERPPEPAAPAGMAGDPEMLAAARLIEERLLDPDLDAGSLMHALGLSRSSLYRAFQPVGGVQAYIRQRRLEHARDLLMRRTGPRPTVSEVAQACGFASDSHFSRAFRKAFGSSPGARRESERSG